MAFLGLCQEDPILRALRNTFHANIVRVPSEQIVPFGAVAFRKGNARYLGHVAPLLDPATPLNAEADDVRPAVVTGVTGTLTRSVDWGLGLTILQGFFEGFGFPAGGLEAVFQGTEEVSFSFNKVQKSFVDVTRLGELLIGKRFNRKNAVVESFYGDTPNDLLVLDAVIQSCDFSVHVKKASTAKFKLKTAELTAQLGDLKGHFKLKDSSDRHLSFGSNDSYLTFAFSCVRFYLDEHGNTDLIDPEYRRIILARQGEQDLHLVRNPDYALLLHNRMGMIEWEP